jgi:hypothetical protein
MDKQENKTHGNRHIIYHEIFYDATISELDYLCRNDPMLRTFRLSLSGFSLIPRVPFVFGVNPSPKFHFVSISSRLSRRASVETTTINCSVNSCPDRAGTRAASLTYPRHHWRRRCFFSHSSWPCHCAWESGSQGRP